MALNSPLNRIGRAKKKMTMEKNVIPQRMRYELEMEMELEWCGIQYGVLESGDSTMIRSD